ncbi:MAG: DUF72 domain-containing protein [Pseudomonadota bacterium]
MQNPLFDDTPPEGEPETRSASKPPRTARVGATVHDDGELGALASALPSHLWLGTSSWTYPGWDGLVWDGMYSDAVLSRQGLGPYSAHPLLRTVCLDRAFYRPLSASQYAAFAAQVPDDFRFVVKAPGVVTDAMVRGEGGKGMQVNPAFLDPVLAVQDFVQPALEGLGHKTGALVFQLSPLPPHLLGAMADVLQRLKALLLALPSLAGTAPDGVVAVEVRDRQFLTPDFVDVLRDAGATFCLGLHAKMPLIEDQLPVLRALWPGPLVCRWNYNRLHGAYGYEDAEKLYAPFNRMMDADLQTRSALARVIAGTIGARQKAYVTISNKAEGSAPLSVIALAREVAGLRS